MALSPHEEQALGAIEDALSRSDPDLAHQLQTLAKPVGAPLRLTLSILGGIIGMAFTLAFCMTTSVLLGIAGYATMVVSLNIFWVNIQRIYRSEMEKRDRQESATDEDWPSRRDSPPSEHG